MFETIVDVVLYNLLEIIIAVISLVVSYYIIPCIKTDLVPWLKERHLYNIVRNFVQAAEKLAEAGVIDKGDKKKYVVNLLKNNGIEVNETVDAFIESCVKELDLIASTVYEEIVKDECDKKE